MSGKNFSSGRYFLKDAVRKQIDFSQTAQNSGLAAPPLQKHCLADLPLIELPDGKKALQRLARMPVGEAVPRRESIRQYRNEALTLEELAALLWATQGVRQVLNADSALRAVPSAGARHALETYLAVNRVDDFPAGLYRYLPFDGALAQLFVDSRIGRKAATACFGQGFIASSAVAFIWTAIPARMEWRYDLAAHKMIALEAGHVGQNLYLACEALELGCCTVAAYDQEACDELLGVDGEEEFTIYWAAVGKKL